MIGIALAGGGARGAVVMRRLLRLGWIVLTGGAEGDVLTLTPPLEIEEALLESFCGAFTEATADP
jgi:4-aminobutyrate aminotransferase-like enzyme